jgi:hypothetical protein
MKARPERAWALDLLARRLREALPGLGERERLATALEAVEPATSGGVPTDDTALAVTDTDGPGVPVVCLNGQFGIQPQWRRVITAGGLVLRGVRRGALGRPESRPYGGRGLG